MQSQWRLVLLAFVTASLIAPTDARVMAQSSKQSQRLQQLLERYPQADADGDGRLSIEEARGYRRQPPTNVSDRARPERPKPTLADVSYGPDQRHIYDLWIPDADSLEVKPIPLFVFFHGGGFVAGDKSSFDPAPYLDRGIAVASGNYRFVNGSTVLSPAPLHDAARMIQHLKHHASSHGLDADRIAVSGGSAGAVISMWIGFHDDLADPGNEDPVARQSTRVTSIVPINGPTHLDPQWIGRHLGGPPEVHGSFAKMFGVAATAELNELQKARIREASPMTHVSSDDPPTLLIYAGAAEGKLPLPPSTSTGVLIHHPYFGKVLHERLDELDVPNEYLPGTHPSEDNSSVILDWLSRGDGSLFGAKAER